MRYVKARRHIVIFRMGTGACDGQKGIASHAERHCLDAVIHRARDRAHDRSHTVADRSDAFFVDVRTRCQIIERAAIVAHSLVHRPRVDRIPPVTLVRRLIVAVPWSVERKYREALRHKPVAEQ